MKIISILGMPTNNLKMFLLELSWVVSNEHPVYCMIEDKGFFNCFSENNLKQSSIGNLTLIHRLEDLPSETEEDSYLLTDLYLSEAELIVFAVEQNVFSVNEVNRFSNINHLPCIIFAFIDFVFSNFDDHYLKNYYIDKRLVDVSEAFFYFEYDEKTKIQQVENQFNRIISLKKYPKSRKMELLQLSMKITGSPETRSYKEFFKCLDERLSIC